jgi:uncharacterized membrane protein YfcA
MTSIFAAVVLVGAGVVAGTVGTAGAITSLISYPALLVVGVAPLPASVANIVALVACWPGSALASRPELHGRGGWLLRYVPIAAAGGATGAALLLSTPAGVFTRLVPFLVAAGSVSLLLAPRISALHGRRELGHKHWWLDAGVLLISLYNGYFGAGSGVMLLALLLVVVDQVLARANALKNMLVGAACLVSAATFVAFGPVDWTAVIPLAAGMLVGSTLGPRVARRVPARILRPLIALIGFGLATQLWISHGT